MVTKGTRSAIKPSVCLSRSGLEVSVRPSQTFPLPPWRTLCEGTTSAGCLCPAIFWKRTAFKTGPYSSQASIGDFKVNGHWYLNFNLTTACSKVHKEKKSKPLGFEPWNPWIVQQKGNHYATPELSVQKLLEIICAHTSIAKELKQIILGLFLICRSGNLKLIFSKILKFSLYEKENL